VDQVRGGRGEVPRAHKEDRGVDIERGEGGVRAREHQGGPREEHAQGRAVQAPADLSGLPPDPPEELGQGGVIDDVIHHRRLI